MEDDTLVHIKALQALMGESMGLSATYCAHSTIMTLHFSCVLTTTSRLHSKPYPGIPLLQIESIVHEMPSEIDLS